MRRSAWRCRSGKLTAPARLETRLESTLETVLAELGSRCPKRQPAQRTATDSQGQGRRAEQAVFAKRTAIVRNATNPWDR